MRRLFAQIRARAARRSLRATSASPTATPIRFLSRPIGHVRLRASAAVGSIGGRRGPPAKVDRAGRGRSPGHPARSLAPRPRIRGRDVHRCGATDPRPSSSTRVARRLGSSPQGCRPAWENGALGRRDRCLAAGRGRSPTACHVWRGSRSIPRPGVRRGGSAILGSSTMFGARPQPDAGQGPDPTAAWRQGPGSGAGRGRSSTTANRRPASSPASFMELHDAARPTTCRQSRAKANEVLTPAKPARRQGPLGEAGHGSAPSPGGDERRQRCPWRPLGRQQSRHAGEPPSGVCGGPIAAGAGPSQTKEKGRGNRGG